jgi:hypothetical protein
VDGALARPRAELTFINALIWRTDYKGGIGPRGSGQETRPRWSAIGDHDARYSRPCR